MRVLIVTESFLPTVNGVTGSVLRVLEHLRRHGRTGFLVPTDDPSALRAAVVALRDDPVLRASCGRAGRRAVLGRDWPAVCDELVGHHRAVVERTRLPRAA